MTLFYNHPVAAAFAICAVAYTVAFAALAWPHRRPR